MLLTKEKILKDKEFLGKLVTEIGKFDNSIMINSLANASADYDLSNRSEENRYNTFLLILLTDLKRYMLDNVENTINIISSIVYSLLQNENYKAIVENIAIKIFDDYKDDIPKIISIVLSSLLSSEEGKTVVRKIFAECEDVLVDYKKESKEPWVNIVGETYDAASGRMKMSLDWNEAFIKLLRKQGMMGESEDELVEQWLKGISSQ